MKGLNTQKLAAYFFVVVSIFLFSSFSSCDEIIDKAKQLIPEAGDKYNAAEEMRGAQGTSDKIRPYAPKGANTPNKVGKGCYYTLSWHSTPNASQYCVNWSFHNNNIENMKERTSGWIDKCEYGWNVPDKEGIMYVNVYSKNSAGQSLEPLSFIVTICKKGKLIFLTHGLSSDRNEFKETVKLLKSNGSYFDLGCITMRDKGNYLNVKNNSLSQIVDEKICSGFNVLVRTEFSAGNLSFDDQLKEMEQMVDLFEGHNADIVFVGHSMGGLASINYGICYANAHKNKNIKIITVDTPYHPNNYAKSIWLSEYIDKQARVVTEWASQQQRGEAHRDLGGISFIIYTPTGTEGTKHSALQKLKTKWENNANNKRITLHAIAVSMYGKDGEDCSNDMVGDGVVDIPSQQGIDWSMVSRSSIIPGNQNNPHWFQEGERSVFALNDFNPYHHINTPDREEVIEQIKNLIEQ